MTTPSGNRYVDSILWGGAQWAGNTITYYFDNGEANWSAREKAAFRAALDAWASVADLNFVQVFAPNLANLREFNLSDQQMQAETGSSGVLGFHEVPTGGNQAEGYFNYEAYGAPTIGTGWHPAGLNTGGYGYLTFLHELGHGLGLAHPHDNGGGSPRFPGVVSDSDWGDNRLNQGFNTAMSYNDGWDAYQRPNANGISAYGYNEGPGAIDVAAIQFLYGANMTANAGNTVYTITDNDGWRSIWDVGGVDTIRYAGRGDARIDLGSATLDNSPTGGGAPSFIMNSGANRYYGGYTIAADFTNVLPDVGGETGVIIENVLAGSGDDRIFGNGVRNILRGNDGNDTIYGMNGHDALLGGRGHDRLYGGADNDLLSGDVGNDMLAGGSGRDRMAGHGGADRMFGSGGNDVFNGGAGADLYVGGGGADWFMFRDGYDTARIRDFQDDMDSLLLEEAMWGGGLTATQVVNTFATDTGTDIVFNFGGGDVIVLQNFANSADLVDDILFI